MIAIFFSDSPCIFAQKPPSPSVSALSEGASGVSTNTLNSLSNGLSALTGATSSDEFEDEMRVTVIATGFEQAGQKTAAAPKAEPAPAEAPKAEPAKPAPGAGDISDIDEIFKIFNR